MSMVKFIELSAQSPKSYEDGWDCLAARGEADLPSLACST